MLGPPRTMTKWVVIQATPFCDANCCYFSLSDRFSPKYIDHRTLEYALEFPFSNCGGVTLSNKLSLLERVQRLRERMKQEGVDTLRLVSSGNEEEDEDDIWSKRG
jgi:hypothetical protein